MVNAKLWGQVTIPVNVKTVTSLMNMLGLVFRFTVNVCSCVVSVGVAPTHPFRRGEKVSSWYIIVQMKLA